MSNTNQSKEEGSFSGGAPESYPMSEARKLIAEWASPNGPNDLLTFTNRCIAVITTFAETASEPAGVVLPAVLTPRMATAAFHGLGLSGTECQQRYTAMRAALSCQPACAPARLTDERIDEIQREWIAQGMTGPRSFARAIEREFISSQSANESRCSAWTGGACAWPDCLCAKREGADSLSSQSEAR